MSKFSRQYSNNLIIVLLYVTQRTLLSRQDSHKVCPLPKITWLFCKWIWFLLSWHCCLNNFCCLLNNLFFLFLLNRFLFLTLFLICFLISFINYCLIVNTLANRLDLILFILKSWFQRNLFIYRVLISSGCLF